MHTESAHASIRCSCFNNGLIFQASVHSQTSEHQDATTKLAELRRQKDEMQIKVKKSKAHTRIQELKLEATKKERDDLNAQQARLDCSLQQSRKD
ncbi:hypothetical protein DUNSADRAFT_1612 [Dunaliella salina]|uniref:Uncharacterized protein n=1 Tax=Dunaliella salina TaxID=3046 RepID=A0ABQ7H8P2_DUNSA|nr:hypothetical protein DUNSADRAFT_1612 [Dunaliella salina]|eukprot:KAF5843185.1 hypothetical protein DUNSADRAFT_1612 [Dunaliella salina]